MRDSLAIYNIVLDSEWEQFVVVLDKDSVCTVRYIIRARVDTSLPAT